MASRSSDTTGSASQTREGGRERAERGGCHGDTDRDGGRLEGLTLVDGDSGASEPVPAAAVFVPIGAEPHTFWLDGDVRHGSVKRVATAVGEGAAAVQLVHEHLNERAR